MVDRLLKRIVAFADANSLFRPKDSIIVGVSGGPDSVFLLHVLAALRDTILNEVPLIVAHVNYQLRGRESDKDAEFVETLALKGGFPFALKIAGPFKKGNLQAEARAIRYAFFEELCHEYRAQAVAVAHTANDQVETVLLHWLQGAGRNGLSGMRAKNENIIRPLLLVAREEILGALQERNLTYHEDQSNRSNGYKRNRIREKIIPLLVEEAPKDWLMRASRAALLMGREEGVLRRVARQALLTLVERLPSGDWCVDLKKARGFPVPLRFHIWRSLYEEICGGGIFLSYEHTEKLDHLAMDFSKKGGRELSLPALKAARSGSRLYLWREGEGVTGCELPEKISLKEGANVLCATCNLRITVEGKMNLFVRFPKPGDRIHVPGVGTRKLQDLFIDEKIPRHWRKHIPLVVDETDRVRWIPGFRGFPRMPKIKCQNFWWGRGELLNLSEGTEP